MHACRCPSEMLKEDDYMPIISSESHAIHGEKTHFDLQRVGLIYQGRQKLLQSWARRRSPLVALSHLHAPLIPGPCWPQASPRCGLC